MILVTGATGFLGAELVRQLLETGVRVRCIKRKESKIPEILKNSIGIEWVEADVLDLSDLEDAFSGVTQVYHCAAKISFSRKEEDFMNAVNVEGTANVVNLCLDNGVRLLHVSSVATLGNAKQNEAVSEENFWDAYDKNGVYAVSKYRSEMEVWRGINEGLDAVIVNPSVIIGENVGENGSGQIFKLVAAGLKYYTVGSIGLVDVKDVAKCMMLLMQSNKSGERFLVNAENYSYQRFFSEIATSYGMTVPVKSLPKIVLQLVARLSIIGRLFMKNSQGITKDIVSAAFNQTVYSNKKIVD
ncbi:NAD-dependent epimerase/dehydratase family protein, partial [Pseudoxanthomonas sp. SGD-10]